jgi:predicted nucleotidyltransferase
MTAENLDKIASYFLEKAQIKRAWLFGSHARGTHSPTSDIDIQIQVFKNTPFTLFDLAEIQQDLSQLLALEVDLVMLGAPLKSIAKQLNHDKILIYENLHPKLERANTMRLKWM